LIIDDEIGLGKATKKYFEAFGLKTEFLESAEKTLSFLKENSADLLLLDINLKNESGFDLCKKLREDYNMPILFISARLSSDDILLALNIGGDDYITKPYELSILLAKVKTRLARERQQNKIVKAADLVVDLENRKAIKAGVELDLTNKEFKLLALLVQNPNRTLTKEEIFSKVWGDSFFSDGTLNVHIRKLREKIEKDPDDPKLIKTVWKVGYVFEVLNEK